MEFEVDEVDFTLGVGDVGGGSKRLDLALSPGAAEWASFSRNGRGLGSLFDSALFWKQKQYQTVDVEDDVVYNKSGSEKKEITLKAGSSQRG